MAIQRPPRPDGLVFIAVLVKGDRFEHDGRVLEVAWVYPRVAGSSNVNLDVRTDKGVSYASVPADMVVKKLTVSGSS